MLMKVKGLNREIGWAIGFALVGAVGVGFYSYLASGKDMHMLNNFLATIAFGMLAFLYRKMPKLEKGEKIFAGIFATLLAMILTLGAELDGDGEIAWGLMTAVAIGGMAVTIYPIVGMIVELINRLNLKNIKEYRPRKMWWVTFGLILLGGILVLLATWPGVYGYDAGFQMMEVLDESVDLTVKYPLPFCFLLSGLVNLGHILFNSYEIGLAMFSLLQLILMTLVATKVTMTVLKRTRNAYLYWGSVAFFGLFPIYTVLTVSTTQDTLFAGVFALLFLKLLEMVEDKDFWKKKYNYVVMPGLILLLCLMRLNGVYCILVAMILVLIFCKERRLLVAGMFIVPVALYFGYNGVLGAMGIGDGHTIREMASIPSQQLARVYNYRPDLLSEKENEDLKRYYIYLDDFKYYLDNPSISDLMKAAINEDAVSEDPKGYVGLWMNVGLKDPENYIEAFLMNNLGMWYPNKNYKDTRMFHPYVEYEMMDAKFYNEKYVAIERTSLFPLYDEVLRLLLVRNAWKGVPVVSSVFTTGTYFVMTVGLIGMMILRKNWKLLVPMALVVGLYVTVILAPVMLLRYMYGIIVIAPMLVTLLLEQRRKV